MSLCEWPRRVGDAKKCGKSATLIADSMHDGEIRWSRDVCDVHAAKAQRLGWSVTRTVGGASISSP